MSCSLIVRGIHYSIHPHDANEQRIKNHRVVVRYSYVHSQCLSIDMIRVLRENQKHENMNQDRSKYTNSHYDFFQEVTGDVHSKET